MWTMCVCVCLCVHFVCGILSFYHGGRNEAKNVLVADDFLIHIFHFISHWNSWLSLILSLNIYLLYCFPKSGMGIIRFYPPPVCLVLGMRSLYVWERERGKLIKIYMKYIIYITKNGKNLKLSTPTWSWTIFLEYFDGISRGFLFFLYLKSPTRLCFLALKKRNENVSCTLGDDDNDSHDCCVTWESLIFVGKFVHFLEEFLVVQFLTFWGLKNFFKDSS